MRVVALGGGTGLPVVLKGLSGLLFPPGGERAPSKDRPRLTAVVTVADDGGSSGRLRRAYGVPAPGDIRNCLLALAGERSDLVPIFDYRFNGGGGAGLHGHSLGNLILTALCQLENDFPRAVRRAGRILGVRGQVLPATLGDVTLQAELTDGKTIDGESRIAAAGRPTGRVRLRPSGARALPEALEAIERADLIVIGPGSLYTSLIAVLLVQALAAAIAQSKARVVLVMNLMVEPGETDGYTATDVLLAIRRHAPRVRIDDVLLNDRPISRSRVEPYERGGAAPIAVDVEALRVLGCRPLARDILGAGPLVRHDPAKLGRALLDLSAEGRQAIHRHPTETGVRAGAGVPGGGLW
jgi:uncharacterized cofD-like protein